MERSIIKRNSEKALTAKPLVKPPPGDKTLGVETAIFFYEIEDGDKNQEGEESEILIIHDKSLAATKQNLFKRKFPYINMFDHQVSAVVRAMRDLPSGVFEQL